MISKITSAAVLGIDAYLVAVEVDIAFGLPGFSTVGLPEGAVKESKERVRAAIKNAGFDYPHRHITVNLAPADIRKEGAAFDLPIALGILAATGEIPPDTLAHHVILGELSLNGDLKSVRGVLPIAVAVKRVPGCALIIPHENAAEAAVVEDLTVLGARTLREVVDFLRGRVTLEPVVIDRKALFEVNSHYEIDFQDVKGQEHAKRALEVAAAGAHNILLMGPPGSGKTMLAKRLPSILPSMSFDEALETSKIYSVTGLLTKYGSLVAKRPFRTPHHTISDAGLIGGGGLPRPGEVSLSHNGVLFLDELPEFKKNVLEVLRQPLEDGQVTISRAIMSLTYPAQFMLVAAMNPCPCGFFGDAHHQCSCDAMSVHRYQSKVSGPLLDRIDIQIEVPAIRYRELSTEATAEPSAEVRRRVETARQLQRERYAADSIHCNAHLTPRLMKSWCAVNEDGRRLLEKVVDKLGMSARGYNRILKVSRTIADLEGSEKVRTEHLSEAIQYRSLDRTFV